MREEAGSRPVQVAASLPPAFGTVARITAYHHPAGTGGKSWTRSSMNSFRSWKKAISLLMAATPISPIRSGDTGNCRTGDPFYRYGRERRRGAKRPQPDAGVESESYSRVQPVLEPSRPARPKAPVFIRPDGRRPFHQDGAQRIEYAIMQLISEVCGILKNAGSYSNLELYQVFDRWNKSELESSWLKSPRSISKKTKRRSGPG